MTTIYSATTGNNTTYYKTREEAYNRNCEYVGMNNPITIEKLELNTEDNTISVYTCTRIDYSLWDYEDYNAEHNMFYYGTDMEQTPTEWFIDSDDEYELWGGEPTRILSGNDDITSDEYTKVIGQF